MQENTLTAEEIRTLRSLARQDQFWFLESVRMFSGGVSAATLILLPLGILWKWLSPWANSDRDTQIFFWLIFATGLAAVCAFLVTEWKDRAQRRATANSFYADASNGVAQLKKYEIRRVVEIEEYEDEGAGFLLEMPCRKVLCLVSQDLYDFATNTSLEADAPDRRGEFPQDHIMLRVAPLSGWLLDIRGCGNSLRPFAKVKTSRRQFVKDKASGGRNYVGPQHMTTYDGPIENLLPQWRYKLESMDQSTFNQ